MELPSVDEVRKRIMTVEEEKIRYCLMAVYLFAGRISEVVGRKNPADDSVAGGPKGTDVKLDKYLLMDREVDAVVFKVRTSKRQGRERAIALPLEEVYERACLFRNWSKMVLILLLPFRVQFELARALDASRKNKKFPEEPIVHQLFCLKWFRNVVDHPSIYEVTGEDVRLGLAAIVYLLQQSYKSNLT
jgi:hypothetical protein